MSSIIHFDYEYNKRHNSTRELQQYKPPKQLALPLPPREVIRRERTATKSN